MSSNKSNLVEDLRKAVVAQVREDIDMIGEPTRTTWDIVIAFNNLAETRNRIRAAADQIEKIDPATMPGFLAEEQEGGAY